jgi:hypothetical protein
MSTKSTLASSDNFHFYREAFDDDHVYLAGAVFRDTIDHPQRPRDRSSVLEQIEASWNKQTRRPSAWEIGDWIATGRK